MIDKPSIYEGRKKYLIKNNRVFILLLRKNDYQQKTKRTYELQLVVK